LPLPRLLPASFILILAGLFPRPAPIVWGNAKVSVLDVGQGLAVVVQTAHHVLVYDTGMKFLNGVDMAQLAIIPYLQLKNIHRIDAVVISHPDLDHRGGLTTLAKQYPIKKLLVDNPKVYHHAVSCHTTADWQWDGVNLHFFALPEGGGSKNNRSCVLQIKSAQGSSVLLTGDIERAAEAYLVEHYGNLLHSSVLLVPHHGSKSSSTPEFVKSVAAEYAVVSYGLGNRYHFPHPQALSVYQQQRIPVKATASKGCIEIDLATLKPMGRKLSG